MRLDNYAAADAYLRAGRDANYRRAPNGVETRLIRDGETGSIHVQYHGTSVVTMHTNGTFTLRSGGWQSATTKTRINAYSPARLYQERFAWYVSRRPLWDSGRVDFTDGMTVDASGNPLEAVTA